MEALLWEACTRGDLGEVKRLVEHPGINLNWGDPERGRTPFYRACSHNRVHVVEFLRHLPGIDVDKPATDNASPFYIACQFAFLSVVALLIHDPRVNVNRLHRDGCSALWKACYEGTEVVVKTLLASSREIGTAQASLPGARDWNSTTAAQIARKEHVYWITHDKQEIEKYGSFPGLADLVDEYAQRPRRVAARMRKELGLSSPSSDLFCLVGFVCEDLLRVDTSVPHPAAARIDRFFKIACKLHMDLQTVLVQRSQGLSSDLVPVGEFKLSLAALAKSLAAN